MDLGMFRWGRNGFWVTIAGPPVIMAAVYLPCTLYGHYLNRSSERLDSLLNHVPQMNTTVRLAADTLKRLAPVRGREGESSADLSLRIQIMAQQHGVVIRSLMPEDGPGQGKAGVTSDLSMTSVTMQGEGPLSGIAAMLDSLQRPECLCRLDNVRIRLITMVPDPVYGCDVVMRCYKAPAFEEE